MILRKVRDVLVWLSDASRAGADAIGNLLGRRALRRYEAAEQRRVEAAAAQDLLERACNDRVWASLSAEGKDALLRKPKPNRTSEYLRRMGLPRCTEEEN